MVHLASEIEDMLADAASRIADMAVSQEKAEAPVISGQLRASIHKVPQGRFAYKIVTDAYGDNGFAYPAHIEAGEGVVATNAKALHFKIGGREIITKSTQPSAKSHFARKTIAYIHI